jgi:hypothetical protein
MSKKWIMLTGLLFPCFVGTSHAHPLDSPDIVYIDGQPCNSACQSYMAWSQRKFSVRHSAPVEAAPAESPPIELVPEKPALRSVHSPARRATAAPHENAKPAVRRVAKQAVPLSPAKIAKPAGDAAVSSAPAPTSVAALPSPESPAARPKVPTLQEQVAAATALAEQVTAASAPAAPHREAVDAEALARVFVAEGDNLVAVVLTRPEIKAVSDLSGKDVAIEDQQSASSTSIRAAIASAGAAEVKLNEASARAIDRLVGGEVQAAVLTLVSAEAAAWFPDVPGYRVFRIPLSPGAPKANL